MENKRNPELRFKKKGGEEYEDWEEKRLGEVANIKTGESNREDSNLYGEYTFFDRSQSIRKSNIYLFDTEAVIVGGEGADFVPKYFIGKFDLHQRAYAIMPHECLNGLFIYYYITKNRDYLRNNAVGSTVKSLRLPMFDNFPIQLPSLEEQEKIAGCLSSLDRVIEKGEEETKKLKEYKKGLMQKLFSRELRFKKANGEEYADWEEKKLGEVANIKTGESNREDSNLYGEYTFFDRSQSIRKSNIYLFDTEAVIVGGEGADFVPKYFIGKFDLHQRAYAIMPHECLNGLFIYYYITKNRDYLRNNAVGSTVKSLRLPMFDNFPIQLPSLEEQEKIAGCLSSLDRVIEKGEEETKNLKEYKKGLMQKLFPKG